MYLRVGSGLWHGMQRRSCGLVCVGFPAWWPASASRRAWSSRGRSGDSAYAEPTCE